MADVNNPTTQQTEASTATVAFVASSPSSASQPAMAAAETVVDAMKTVDSNTASSAVPIEDLGPISLHGILDRLASYACHKVVKAAAIADVDLPRHILTVADKDGKIVTNIVGLPARFFVTRDGEGNELPTPNVGDYLVVYEDEYVSWSPAATFNAGYVLNQA